jgi:hypothetical protein
VLEVAVDLFHLLKLVKVKVDLEDCFFFMALIPTAFFHSVLLLSSSEVSSQAKKGEDKMEDNRKSFLKNPVNWNHQQTFSDQRMN